MLVMLEALLLQLLDHLDPLALLGADDQVQNIHVVNPTQGAASC